MLVRARARVFPQGVCQDHRPLQRACGTMELVDPALCAARNGSLRYLASTRRTCAQRLFDLRQPEHLELSKHGATAQFLRQLLTLCGFEVVPAAPPGRPPPPPEMECLAEWFASAESPFAKHPSGQAFHWCRDVVLLAKFLATMETREAELMRKRKQVNRFARFSLSFDPSGGAGLGGRWAMRRGSGGTGAQHRRPLQWEAVNFRGVDLSICDLAALGCGGRAVGYGEGLLVRSPADVSRLAPDARPKQLAAGGVAGVAEVQTGNPPRPDRCRLFAPLPPPPHNSLCLLPLLIHHSIR
jgi:hypothetical protein